MNFLTLLIVTMATTISAKKSDANPSNVHQMITRRQQNEHKYISNLLDKLLENYVNWFYLYNFNSNNLIWKNFLFTLCLIFPVETRQDNSLRPNFGGSPALIEIDLMVRSMGPVSEVEMVRRKFHFNWNFWLKKNSKNLSPFLTKLFLK